MNSVWKRSALLGCVILAARCAFAAPPNVTALFPAGCQVGQSVEVTAQGALGDKPQAWISREGVKLEFAESGNKFKVIVAENAAPGQCWIRGFNAEGASSLRPFVIGTLAEVAEKEPNNSAKEAQKLESSQVVVNGVLEKGGDVDTFAVSLKAGQTLVASLMAKGTLGSPMDGVLQVLGPRGFVMEHNDDDHGLDPQIVFTAPSDGEYGMRVFAFPETANSSIQFAGGANFIYRLTLTTGAFVDHAEPMSVGRSGGVSPPTSKPDGGETPPPRLRLHGWNLPPELVEVPVDAVEGSFVVRHALLSNTLTLPVESHSSVVELREPSAEHQELLLPSSMTGVIGKPGEVDVFRVKLAAKQAIVIRTDARSAGSPLDPLLRILKADGSQLQEVDDGAKGDFDPDANFTAPAEGEYRIAITDRFGMGGPRFFYRITALPSRPDFELRVAADSFVLTADKPLEIPVTVDRQRGFAPEIEVVAVELPEKVTAEAVVSEKSGDKSKSVKLVLKAEAGVSYSGPIRIRGRVKSDPPIEKPVLTTLTSLGASTGELWLTVATAAAK
ncbi:MAG: PPC domain-containing protein [Planctomycetaceae bacterium]|nr:PPC domain-containing protein [Planctomycetaceae bacterium]